MIERLFKFYHLFFRSFLANIPREIYRGRDVRAFLSSCAAMVALMTLFGMGLFLNLVHSLSDPEHSVNIYNAASLAQTLKIILIIALIGFPLFLSYTVSIYWIFRGKVKLDTTHY